MSCNEAELARTEYSGCSGSHVVSITPSSSIMLSDSRRECSGDVVRRRKHLECAKVPLPRAEVIRCFIPAPRVALKLDEDVAARVDLLGGSVHLGIVGGNRVRTARHLDVAAGDYQLADAVIGKVIGLHIHQAGQISGCRRSRSGDRRRRWRSRRNRRDRGRTRCGPQARWVRRQPWRGGVRAGCTGRGVAAGAGVAGAAQRQAPGAAGPARAA